MNFDKFKITGLYINTRLTMDSKLREFIFSRQERGELFYTHVSQVQPVGRYNITREDTEEFWRIYCDSVYQNTNSISGLAERQSDYSPVLNDTDIKIRYNPQKHKTVIDNRGRLYRDTHVRKVVSIYQKHLKQIIVDYKPHHGVCFVLEKQHATLDDKGRICNGFHLHFINAFMHKVDQDVHLYPRVKEDINSTNVFLDCDVTASGETIDKVTGKPWLMYGARKQAGGQAYRLSKILDDNCNEITLSQALSDFRLLDVNGVEIDTADREEYLLPRILSVHPENRTPVTLRSDLALITRSRLKRVEQVSVKERDPTKLTEELKTASDLVKLLSSERADNYEDWMDVGWTLYNVGYGTTDALDIWIEFSRRATRDGVFSEKNCVYQWENMRLTNKGIGSLKRLARIDSPEGYKKIQDRQVNKLANDSLNGGHADMARLLHVKFGDEFVCADIEKDIWYAYENHRWVQNTRAVKLRQKISTDLVEYYKRIKKDICNKMGDEDDDGELRKKLNVVNKIIANLKSYPFKSNIMKECAELFYDADFYSQLNANVNLLHFKNGILDLEKMCFRPGTQKDYVSMTTGYEFREHKWDDIEVIECIDHFTKVFPDPELYEYFMEYCASLLKGGNSAKTFLIKTGVGDNGKSINIDFLKLVFGKYMRILPTSLITGQRTQSSQATPELSGIRGVRFCVLQEPNKGDKMNIGIVKELSGNDEIYTRGLFKEGEEVRPMFKLCLICNTLPVLPSDDQATWNRIRVLPYESCFPKDLDRFPVPDSVEEQFRLKRFPRDPFFSEKLPNMKTAFAWMIFEKFKQMKLKGRMPEPEKVRNATAIYRRNNDVFLQFITERIMAEPSNKEATMTVAEAYNAFKTWFEDSYPNLRSKVPNKSELKEDLINKWGELVKGKWIGYRIRTLEDDEREGNILVLREEDLANPGKPVIEEKKEEPEPEKIQPQRKALRHDECEGEGDKFLDVEPESEPDSDDENETIARLLMRK
jgi:P4 family phage/plasmid primase-like protien